MRKFRLAAFFMTLIMVSAICMPTVYAAESAVEPTASETASESSTSKYEGITVGDATPEATPEPEKLFSDSEGFVCDTLTNPNSESIFMISLDTDKVVYTMNPDRRRPMASLTKIMSYIVAVEQIEDVMNTRTTVPQSVADELAGTGSSLAELQVGEEFSIFELLNLMMVPSGNDAALTIAKYVDSLNIAATEEDQPFDENQDGLMSFVEMMNRKAVELKCRDTHFTNPHGLHHRNHYSTAREIAAISQYALTLPYFAEITSQQFYDQLPTNMNPETRTVTTSNRMMLSWMEEYYTYTTGLKTGSLNESGYCISATALYDGYSYLVVCMGSPYIDENGARTDYHGEMFDAATLFRWAFLNIENKTLVTDGKLITEIPVRYAWEKDTLQVLASGNMTAMLPKKLAADDIVQVLDLPEYVDAPIKKGDRLGTATYSYQGEELCVVPLVAAESVERSEVIQTIEQGKDIFSSTWFIATAAVIIVLSIIYLCLMISMNKKRRKMRRIRKYRDL